MGCLLEGAPRSNIWVLQGAYVLIYSCLFPANAESVRGLKELVFRPPAFQPPRDFLWGVLATRSTFCGLVIETVLENFVQYHRLSFQRSLRLLKFSFLENCKGLTSKNLHKGDLPGVLPLFKPLKQSQISLTQHLHVFLAQRNVDNRVIIPFKSISTSHQFRRDRLFCFLLIFLCVC